MVEHAEEDDEVEGQHQGLGFQLDAEGVHSGEAGLGEPGVLLPGAGEQGLGAVDPQVVDRCLEPLGEEGREAAVAAADVEDAEAPVGLVEMGQQALPAGPGVGATVPLNSSAAEA